MDKPSEIIATEPSLQDNEGRRRLDKQLDKFEKRATKRSRSRSQSPTTKALIRAQDPSDELGTDKKKQELER